MARPLGDVFGLGSRIDRMRERLELQAARKRGNSKDDKDAV